MYFRFRFRKNRLWTKPNQTLPALVLALMTTMHAWPVPQWYYGNNGDNGNEEQWQQQRMGTMRMLQWMVLIAFSRLQCSSYNWIQCYPVWLQNGHSVIQSVTVDTVQIYVQCTRFCNGLYSTVTALSKCGPICITVGTVAGCTAWHSLAQQLRVLLMQSLLGGLRRCWILRHWPATQSCQTIVISQKITRPTPFISPWNIGNGLQLCR